MSDFSPTISPSTGCDTDDAADAGAIIPVPFNYILIFFLVCLSALFSGLTLGLLGLDVVGLEIIIGGDNEIVKKAAQQILPIRKRGNLLLCTLLFGNVATNSLLSILMANMTSGVIGFLSSTIMIVIFGEIIPQALCSRHALAIGQKSLPLVKFFIFLFFLAAYPLSVVLDYFLGEEVGTIHSRQELLTMLQIHYRHQQLDQDTVNVMSGAIQYRDKKAEDVVRISLFFHLSSLPASPLSDDSDLHCLYALFC
jgi:metal transporter CNNM